jgi:hypothetical protein
MRLVVEVTQEDIDKGERKNCFECPLALAIHRASGKQVQVGTKRVYMSDSSGTTVGSALLPKAARDIIRAVDTGNKDLVHPTKLTLHFT